MFDAIWLMVLTLVLALDVVMLGMHARDGNVGWAIWFAFLIILLTVAIVFHIGGMMI